MSIKMEYVSREDFAKYILVMGDALSAIPIETETMAVMQFVDKDKDLRAQAIYSRHTAPTYQVGY